MNVRKPVALRISIQALEVRGGVLPDSQGLADTLEAVAFRMEASSMVEEGRAPCPSP